MSLTWNHKLARLAKYLHLKRIEMNFSKNNSLFKPFHACSQVLLNLTEIEALVNLLICQKRHIYLKRTNLQLKCDLAYDEANEATQIFEELRS